MKAKITAIDARYALDIVNRICERAGPGLPGSLKERERAAIIEKELKSHLGEENVFVEKFSVSPFAFVSSYAVSAVLMVIAVLLNKAAGSGVFPMITSVSALVFSVVSPTIFILEFVLGYRFIDPLFMEKESINVIGTFRNPATTFVKRLLIISGHHDSAPENTWLRFTGYGLFFLSGTFLVSFFVLPVMNILQLAGIVSGSSHLFSTGTIGWIVLLYPVLPSVLFGITFARGKKNNGNVPGAADNLSACSLALAMCRFLVKNPSVVPDGIEIRFITFGSEEAGCRGSGNYVRNHLEELKQLDLRMLNYETVVYPQITILTSDVNGTVKNAAEHIENLVAAAKRASVPYRLKPAMLGVSNDSGPFSKAGLKAATLLPFKIPQQLVAFYHQKWDTPDKLTMEPFLNVLKLTLEWVKNEGE